MSYQSDEIEEYLESLPKGRCNPCKHAKAIHAQEGFMFLGCCCKPYKGQWVAEIKDCPIGRMSKRNGQAEQEASE